MVVLFIPYVQSYGLTMEINNLKHGISQAYFVRDLWEDRIKKKLNLKQAGISKRENEKEM